MTVLQHDPLLPHRATGTFKRPGRNTHKRNDNYRPNTGTPTPLLTAHCMQFANALDISAEHPEDAAGTEDGIEQPNLFEAALKELNALQNQRMTSKL